MTDYALRACQAWITSWRMDRPKQDQPSLTFARHLGGCAIQAIDDGEPDDVVASFRAAGYDGACGLCGRKA